MIESEFIPEETIPHVLSILPESENIPGKNHSYLTVFRPKILVSDCLKIADFSVPIVQVCPAQDGGKTLNFFW